MSPILSESLPGLDGSRASLLPEMQVETLPAGFPLVAWTSQQARYDSYWSWWQGGPLEEEGPPENGQPTYLYPLKINEVRTYSRVHNNMLWGEIPSTPHLPFKPQVKAQPSLFENRISDTDRQYAEFVRRIIVTVLEQSHSAADFVHAGLVSQFTGGAYFKLAYRPYDSSLRLPLALEYLKPDFVLPVWDANNEWRLSSCYIAYRIHVADANARFGLNLQGPGYANYVEHWTPTEYSVYLDAEPLVQKFNVNSQVVTRKYHHLPNPFGFVPIYYIPRLREGNFYGSSLVPDIASGLLEYNARMADTGDLIRDNAHRVWVGKNMSGNPRRKKFDKENRTYIDVGHDSPTGGKVEFSPSDPASVESGVTQHNDTLLRQLDRDAFISPVSFGIDEGSQRSGVTLQVRMWPTISLAQIQRVNWSTGLNMIYKDIVRALIALDFKVEGRTLPSSLLTLFTYETKWFPFLPQDEDQMVNRLVQFKSTDQMSIRRSLTEQGVDDVEVEYAQILEDKKKDAQLEKEIAEAQKPDPSATAGNQPKQE